MGDRRSTEVMRTVDYLSSAETMRRRELVHGRVREPAAPFYSHQRLVLQIARLLLDHVEQRKLGQVAIAPLDVVLDAERALVVQPDVLFVETDRLSIIRNQVWGAPDLVVEVLSVGNDAYDRGQKLSLYRDYGVRECWLVEIRSESVTVIDFARTPTSSRVMTRTDRIRSSVLPDLTATASSVFDC